MPEFFVGGIALAAVALIAFGGLPAAQPQNSLPAPKRYASVSIESSEALARLSLERPGLSDITAAARDVQSPDTRVAASTAAPIERNDAKAPLPPAADRSAALAGSPVGLPLQRHGIETEPTEGLTDRIWDPSSSDRLRGSRPANGQRGSVPEPPSARADPGFIGVWTDDTGRCPTGRKAPLVISAHAAKTANGECDFGSVAREAENRWRITAMCTIEGKFWRAKIALKLIEPKLVWSSERGTATYVRCKRGA